MSTREKTAPLPPHPRFRRVLSPHNSECGTAPLHALNSMDWWMDKYDGDPLYLHMLRPSDGSRHRVYPRVIDGYYCTRLAMVTGRLCWVYDATRKGRR